MAYLKSLSALAGVAAAATLLNALPAQAEGNTLATEAVTEILTLDATEAPAQAIVISEAIPTTAASEVSPELTEAVPADAATTATLLVEPTAPVAFQVADEALVSFDNAGLQAALNDSITEAAPALSEGVELAQSSRRPYADVSPAYLGVAGNVGFGDPDSAIGDFGVNVISKISLGPRFSLRPGFFISERFTNFAIPLTYNFNTVSASGVRFQPYVGAGVDVPFNGNTALMLNAGADVPISRAFTLNAATNVRVTSGFGLGLSLGVGYNFPFVFE